MVAVNSNWLFRGVWNLIYPMLDEYMKQKIILCGGINSREYK